MTQAELEAELAGRMAALKADELAYFGDMKPYLRSAIALAIFLRFGKETLACYETADEFLVQLEKDVAAK